MKKLKFTVVPFGCQMSFHDAQIIEQKLTKAGFKYLENTNEKNQELDLIIFTTCAVRGHAEQRLYSRVENLKNLKKRRKFLIGIGGCLSQKEQYKLIERMPWVDFIFGTQAVSQIENIVKEVLDTGKAYDENWFTEGEYVPSFVDGSRIKGFKAWVSIMKGCNNFCTYCIVPYVRGREYSRDAQDILAEIKKLVDSGIKEIMLLGQNVNSYGFYPERGLRFPDLLEKVAQIDGLKRIRFTTSHPKDFSDQLIEVIARYDNICNQIHLPVQSGATKILEKMNRGYTREDYLTLVEKIKSNIPDVALSTDIICGFPGESEEDFQQTLSLVEKVRYDSAFTFYYSPREGTKAAEWKDLLLPEEERKKRLWQLIEIQKKITHERTQERVGKVELVLVEGKERTGKYQWQGRCERNRVVVFNGGENLIAKLVKVKVNSASSWTLFGELVEVLG